MLNNNIIVVTYVLDQRYGNGLIDLKSRLIVTMNNVQSPNYDKNDDDIISNNININNKPPSFIEITHIEEQWNGVRLLDGYIFKISRRLNGLVSWVITSSRDRPKLWKQNGA